MCSVNQNDWRVEHRKPYADTIVMRYDNGGKMTKQIKEILERCKIQVKWYNIHLWVKEDYNNLLELVEKENITITRHRKEGLSKNDIIVTWIFGRQKIREYTTIIDLERTLYTMVGQKCLYLGDRTKITTRFKKWSF